MKIADRRAQKEKFYALLSTIIIGADTLPYSLGKPRTRETFLGSLSEKDQE